MNEKMIARYEFLTKIYYENLYSEKATGYIEKKDFLFDIEIIYCEYEATNTKRLIIRFVNTY